MHVVGRQIADVHRRDHVPSHYFRPTPRQEHGEVNDGYVGVDTNNAYHLHTHQQPPPGDTRHQRDITESVSKNHNQTRPYLVNVFPTG
jgi:hypothetical protein